MSRRRGAADFGPAAVRSYISGAFDGSSPYSITPNFGAADARKYAIIGVGRAGTGSITGVTVGGANATICQNDADGRGLYVAAIPAGGSQEVVVSTSGTISNLHIEAWSALLYLGVPFDAQRDNTNTATLPSISVPKDGILIVSAYRGNNSGMTITGTGITQDAGTTTTSPVGMSRYALSGAYAAAQTVSNIAGSEGVGLIYAASFR